MHHRSQPAGRSATESLTAPPEAEAAPDVPPEPAHRGPIFQHDERNHPVSEGEVSYIGRIRQGFRQLLSDEESKAQDQMRSSGGSTAPGQSMPLPLASSGTQSNPVQLGQPQDDAGLFIAARPTSAQQRQASPSEFAAPVMSVNPSGETMVADIEDWPHSTGAGSTPISNVAGSEPVPAETGELAAPALEFDLTAPPRTASQPSAVRQRY